MEDCARQEQLRQDVRIATKEVLNTIAKEVVISVGVAILIIAATVAIVIILGMVCPSRRQG